jgi:hypothetical protein
MIVQVQLKNRELEKRRAMQTPHHKFQQKPLVVEVPGLDDRENLPGQFVELAHHHL